MKIEEQLRALLAQKHLTFAAAESCTGGLIAKRITDIAGASGVFVGGVVSYTNSVKHQILGVPQQMLDRDGAVSESVARAMAEGVRHITCAHYGVSVTGVAGPDSDERGNPVGTVFVALADEQSTSVYPLQLGGDRASIREQAAQVAFSALLHQVEQYKETDYGKE